jgi:hypothetical protein
MQRTRVIGLALVTALALCAVAASGASASSPVWYTCAKAPKNEAKEYTGHYAGKECKKAEYKATGGAYELAPGVGKGKASKFSAGTVILHTVQPATKSDFELTCSSAKGEGTPVAPNGIDKVKLVLSKCHLLGAGCQNGSKKETIETKVLSGKLGWIDEATKTVGTDLAGEAPGTPVAEMDCSALGELRVVGSVIGEDQGNVEAIAKEASLVYTQGHYLGEVVWDEKGDKYAPLVNIPEFEGGSTDILKTEIMGSITGHPEEFYPPGGVPSGLQATVKGKGEAVGIYPEGAE